MTRILVLLTALLLIFSCTSIDLSPDEQLLLGMFKDGYREGVERTGHQDNFKFDAYSLGWVARNDSGNEWDYWINYEGVRTVLATCEYSYMRVVGVEKWKATYHGMSDSRMHHGPVYDFNRDNMCGCFDWVQRFIVGHYYM